jgi:hypothetical protein
LSGRQVLLHRLHLVQTAPKASQGHPTGACVHEDVLFAESQMRHASSGEDSPSS